MNQRVMLSVTLASRFAWIGGLHLLWSLRRQRECLQCGGMRSQRSQHVEQRSAETHVPCADVAADLLQILKGAPARLFSSAALAARCSRASEVSVLQGKCIAIWMSLACSVKAGATSATLVQSCLAQSSFGGFFFFVFCQCLSFLFLFFFIL